MQPVSERNVLFHLLDGSLNCADTDVCRYEYLSYDKTPLTNVIKLDLNEV